jgi:hypothetical protein
MTTFHCTYAGLRQIAGDFIRAIPAAQTREQLDAGLKCVQLHYLGMDTETPHEIAGADALMRIVSREYFDAESALPVG